MKSLLKGAMLYHAGRFSPLDVLIDNGIIISISPNLPMESVDSVFFLPNCHILPGFCDLHVHFREPGFAYKETIQSGSAAAACGGFTTVCAMPNLDPVPDNLAHLQVQLDAIARDATVEVLPYGSITRGRLGAGACADMAALKPYVCAFSDDGSGVQERADMKAAMTLAKELDAIIVAHCEDMSLVPNGGCCHDGAIAQRYQLIGIPGESEWGQIARDLELVRETGCRYHVCHLSTKESVALIRAAKAEGLPVTCEVTPHNLILTEDDLRDEGRFKMNPPIRTAEDRAALVEGFLDGTIDVMATDHAPHSAEEKSGGLAKSVMGVVGLETAFPLLYTQFVKTGKMTLEQLVTRLSMTPRSIFSLPMHSFEVGELFDAAIFDLDACYPIEPTHFLSKGRATPFEGAQVYAQNRMTWCKGNLVYKEGSLSGTINRT